MTVKLPVQMFMSTSSRRSDPGADRRRRAEAADGALKILQDTQTLFEIRRTSP